MTREEIIEGLKFTVDMFLFDPSTGETYPEPRNDMDKTTIDACKGAMELLEQEPCENAVSKQAVIDTIYHECSGENLDIDFAKILLLQRKIKALPPVIPQAIKQQPFINKPCISEGVCREDKIKVLDKIRAEIMDTGAYEQEVNGKTEFLKGINYCLGVIDKYKVGSEE